MRILCLHGYGTSGAILRSQLDAFIHNADASYEFVFLDGEYECQRAHGIGKFAQPPFRCFNESFGPHAIQSSLDHLQDFIDDEGPFDGLLGFSQGGSLALAYLLQMAETMAANPGTPPTFSFAVFLSTIVAFSPDPDFCSHLVTGLTPQDRDQVLAGFPRGASHNDYAALSGPPERDIFFSSLGKVLETSLAGGFIAHDTPLGLDALLRPATAATNSDIDHLPRIIHPAIASPDCRVPIPTVHVVGALDDPLLVSMSKLMEKLCVAPLTRSLVHDGGHDVPRKPRDVQALWSAVEWATREAMRQAW
ncbi:serine hydrolase FSH [Colletotrichum phormii]|uniref:Serine hydrolase FSH n=1 Tax=Colletotrichum phormii TaxID=359342 RepID=A0AAI9ZRY1_9PEZI|nr:serine hydrolase FSH [Colletotrichum phormii]KAK1637092.1 serine hydrolase FSH [Colletotrichum phormii]